jgi:hypothetical protein
MTMSQRRFRVGAGTAGLALVLAVAVSAQAQNPPAGGAAPQGRGGTPPPPQNLQILPKDMPRAELLTLMRGYATALGVMCNYCHVQEGQGGRNDFATDEKAPKKTARVMMTMTAHVNETLASGLGKSAADVTKVQCMTCHRGEAIPKLPPPPAAPAAPAPGR